MGGPDLIERILYRWPSSHREGTLWVVLLSHKMYTMGGPPLMEKVHYGWPSSHGEGTLWVALLSWRRYTMGGPALSPLSQEDEAS